MATALTSVTTQPIQQDIQIYGGDDVSRSSEGLLGRLVSWERDPSSSCCPSAVKTWVLFFVDKLFTFLDWTGIGGRICDGGLQETRRAYMLGQTAPERNTIARERIIDVLGGADACRAIPVVALQNADLQQYLSVNDDYFPQGHWMIQGEDPAGRKFIALRVKLTQIELNMEGAQNIHGDLRIPRIITIHQLQRETAVAGKYWTRNLVINRIVQANLRYSSDLSDNALGGNDTGIPGMISNLRENGTVTLHDHQGMPGFGPFLMQAFTFERNPKP